MRSTLTAIIFLASATAALAAPEPVWSNARPQGDAGWDKKRQTAPSYTNTTTPTSDNGTISEPVSGNGTECPSLEPSTCLTEAQANDAAAIFQSLIRAYTDELALEALTEDFIDYSSAVNIIRNRGNDYPFVVNEATFVGRDAFMFVSSV